MTSSSVARSDGWDTVVEDGGNVDIVPFFLGKGVDAIKIIRHPAEHKHMRTYTFFFWPFFLKFLGFFPAVIAS